MTDQNMIEEEITYCEVHPDRETSLRCNKCNRLMCAQCAVQTPIGYRCRECVRQVEDKFYSAGQMDYVIIFAVCAAGGAVGGVIASVIGFWFVGLFLGASVGVALAEGALRATERRKGRHSGEFAAAGIVIGAVIAAAVRYMLVYNDRYGEMAKMFRDAGRELPDAIPGMFDFIIRNVSTDLGLIVFVGLAALAAYNRIKS